MNLEGVVLKHGSHKLREDGVCAMEAVAWLANEPHSDSPQCTCPVIASMVRRLNDRISGDKIRTELLAPLLPKLIGTRATLPVMRKRAFIAADFAVCVVAPIALEARGRKEDAEKLRALPEIVDAETARAGNRATLAAYAAAAYAADAAYADAAAYAAAAASAAAYAAADAAAARAADAAAARLRVYRLTVECIERMCAVTEAP